MWVPMPLTDVMTWCSKDFPGRISPTLGWSTFGNFGIWFGDSNPPYGKGVQRAGGVSHLFYHGADRGWTTSQLEDSWRRCFVNCTSGTSKDHPISPLHRPRKTEVGYRTAHPGGSAHPRQVSPLNKLTIRGGWEIDFFCHEKTGPWLFRVYGGWHFLLGYCGDDFVNHGIRIAFKEPVHWKVSEVVF